MSTIRLRIRGPQGTSTITLPVIATWGDLQEAISAATSLTAFDLMYGYPPRRLGSASLDGDIPLSMLGVNLNGEQITVAPVEAPPVPLESRPAPPSGSSPPRRSSDRQRGEAPPLPGRDTSIPSVPVPSLLSVLTLRVMPDDNSCLFRALSSALLGNYLDGMTELRARVASAIHEDPAKYTRAVLDDKSPDDYAVWIQDPDTWGGGIELAVLSDHFGVEVCSVNVQDLRVDRFNEGACESEPGLVRRKRRIVLVYSGIHYDVLALTERDGADPAEDRKVFDVLVLPDGSEDDGGVLEAARDLCRVLRDRHYFTDTKGFTLRCNVCGWTGTGERAATAHATDTGHMDFGES